MKKITDYSLHPEGFHHPDYYQGFGCTFTAYNRSILGAGTTEREAYNDALEQLAADGFDVSEIEKENPEEGFSDGQPETEVEEISADEETVLQSLDECYKPYKIGNLTFYPSQVLKECDPTAFRCMVSDEPSRYRCPCGEVFDDEESAKECCPDERMYYFGILFNETGEE